MSFRLRQLLAVGVVGVFAVGFNSGQADDVGMVKEKLFEAKKAYDAEVQKFRKSVLEFLDKREETARAAGDKKAVDQIKLEREAFNNEGTLPAMLPAAVKQQLTTARTNLDKAYSAAVRGYLILKEDTLAEAIEKEQQEFKAGVDPTKAGGRCLQFSERGHVELQKSLGLLDLNGSFTVEAWIRFDGKNNANAMFIGDEAWPKMSPAIDVPGPAGWVLRLVPANDPAKSFLEYTAAAANPDWFSVRTSPIRLLDGEWHHIAISKTPEVIRLFVGGKLLGEQKCKSVKFTPGVTDLYLGVRKHGYENRRFEGEYRAFRISSNARYTQAFEPPAAFGKDSSTELLLDFRGTDATKITDLSGKGHDGLLNEVKWADLPKPKK